MQIHFAHGAATRQADAFLVFYQAELNCKRTIS